MAKIVTPTEEALTAKVWQMADVLAAHGIGNTSLRLATSRHMWAFIEKVGTEHIFSCRKCGLQLQTDKCPSINKGTCRDGRRHDWQHDY